MLPSETMIWQPEFTDKTLSRKTGAVQSPIYSDINIPVAIHLASGPLSLNVQTIQILFSLSHHIP
ncbi:hypothetical protein MMO01_29935, partial [Escherichia coli]|nr:hypothetical protein [Escherichia coli]